MLPAVAGFKIKGNSAEQQNWTAAKLPFRAREMDVPSQRENFNHRNTWSILRIAQKLHCVPKFEPDTGTLVKRQRYLGKRGRFAKVS